ncbi:hypothetical protein [uncultured Dokdonia sp.]|uniref:hypothetical protein n=1 Tax=uncultured Dokdonia sp. TaxID=575653 RepID=UPI0030ECA117|tara:strand:+ start:18200 stop:19696 length:1497 start_codon:yes stop_codon:yes gene_type:complete
MKKINRIFQASLIGLLLFSCSADDVVTDQIQGDVTNGSFARIIEEFGVASNATSTSITFDKDGTTNPFTLSSTDEAIGTIESEVFSIGLELTDNQGGALIESLDVFVSFEDRTILEGETEDFSTTESFVKSIPASEFTTTVNGLPFALVTLNETELFPGVDLVTAISNDRAIIRMALNLTDGRTFSVDDTNANVGGIGTFYNSPFQFFVVVDSLVDIVLSDASPASFNEVNVGAGAPNTGYAENVAIIDPLMQFDSVDVFLKLVDNSTLLPTDNDISFTEILLETVPAADFTANAEGNLAREFAYDLDTILNGVSIEDLKIGDTFVIRYKLNLADGSSLSANNAPFETTLPVVECTAPPLEDNTYFTGDYQMEQTDGVDPFFPNYGLAFDSQVITVTNPNGDNGRFFNFSYFPTAFGSPYFMELDLICDFILFSSDIVPGNGTLGCGDGSITATENPALPTTFDLNDDSVIILNVLDFANDAGCGTGSAPVQVTLTKL